MRDEYWYHHLTPAGWVQGSYEYETGGAVDITPPSDTLLTTFTLSPGMWGRGGGTSVTVQDPSRSDQINNLLFVDGLWDNTHVGGQEGWLSFLAQQAEGLDFPQSESWLQFQQALEERRKRHVAWMEQLKAEEAIRHREYQAEVDTRKRLIRLLLTGPMLERDIQTVLRKRYDVLGRLGVLRTALAQMTNAGEIQRIKKQGRNVFVRTELNK